MPSHTVQQGEHLTSIAAKYGFRDYHTIWDDGNNAALKAKRKNPNVLYPGDVLFIPEKQQKILNRPTGSAYVFRVKRQQLELWLVVKDRDHVPVANTKCTLKIDSSSEQLTTDGEGRIHKLIPPTAQGGSITVGDMEIPIKVGHLDPVDEYSGQAARLNNLGYEAGDPLKRDEERIKSAVEEFQCDHDLKVDGICGPLTQAKLKEVHGC